MTTYFAMHYNMLRLVKGEHYGAVEQCVLIIPATWYGNVISINARNRCVLRVSNTHLKKHFSNLILLYTFKRVLFFKV